MEYTLQPNAEAMHQMKKESIVRMESIPVRI